MKIAKLVFLLLTLGIFGPVYATPGMPSIAPSVVFTDAAGNESTDSYFSGSAPIKATFNSTPLMRTDGRRITNGASSKKAKRMSHIL